jgi:hypothetical protein
VAPCSLCAKITGKQLTYTLSIVSVSDLELTAFTRTIGLCNSY